jgi:molecular chaperone DnaK (HSP70)
MGGFRKNIKDRIKKEYSQLSDVEIEEIIKEAEKKVENDEKEKAK